MAWEKVKTILDNHDKVPERWMSTDEGYLKNLLETLSDDEIRRNREACDKFDWIVSRVVREDLGLDPNWFNVKRSSHVPVWYPGAENQPHSTLTITMPWAKIYIDKTTEKKDSCCNFHVKVEENDKITFDKEFTKFGDIIAMLDRISLMLSRYVTSWSNRAQELLGMYTGY